MFAKRRIKRYSVTCVNKNNATLNLFESCLRNAVRVSLWRAPKNFFLSLSIEFYCWFPRWALLCPTVRLKPLVTRYLRSRGIRAAGDNGHPVVRHFISFVARTKLPIPSGVHPHSFIHTSHIPILIMRCQQRQYI